MSEVPIQILGVVERAFFLLLFGIPTNWFSGQSSMPSVSNLGLECHHCHKPLAG